MNRAELQNFLMAPQTEQELNEATQIVQHMSLDNMSSKDLALVMKYYDLNSLGSASSPEHVRQLLARHFG